MAVFALFQESVDLRLYMSGVWHDVAYKGLNGAVAATLADLSTAMVKRTESAIMIDFPGHESYETVMGTITRGNIEKAMSNFSMSIHRVSNADGRKEKMEEAKLDVKEQFLIYAYQDLVDFVTDFQATRSGKPTKRMLEQIDKWNPTLDLRRATKGAETALASILYHQLALRSGQCILQHRGPAQHDERGTPCVRKGRLGRRRPVARARATLWHQRVCRHCDVSHFLLNCPISSPFPCQYDDF